VELRERYRAADVIVLPSRSEPWGLVLNEAMATGCVPVASWGAGATADLVTDGVTGRVVAPGNVAGLRAVLAELVAAPQQLTTLSRAAIERAGRFTPRRCAEGFVEALWASGYGV
jgi:glycosyltransferase involved in cell wall biosynthesis